MGYQIPDLCVYQARWFAEILTPDGVRWTHWKTVPEWEYLELKERIKSGERYQIRILHQRHIEGYGVSFLDEHPEITVNPGL